MADFLGITLFRYSARVPEMDSPPQRLPKTKMDLGDPTRTRIVRKLFCTRAARRTLLLHHSLCSFGRAGPIVRSHGPRPLLRNPLDCVGWRLVPFFTATPSCIACPSTGPARGSTDCSDR